MALVAPGFAQVDEDVPLPTLDTKPAWDRLEVFGGIGLLQLPAPIVRERWPPAINVHAAFGVGLADAQRVRVGILLAVHAIPLEEEIGADEPSEPYYGFLRVEPRIAHRFGSEWWSFDLGFAAAFEGGPGSDLAIRTGRGRLTTVRAFSVGGG
jgi:hypothetical protein